MRHIAIVPAAGSGTRMGLELPKQYLDLLGKPLLWHALRALVDTPEVSAVYVVLAPTDEHWAQFDWRDLGEKLRPIYHGGATRAMSVTQALRALQDEIAPQDWVLVHDGARACITPEQISHLITTLANDPVGGLLAVPVADTMKRVDAEGRVAQTVPREGLWQAQTPQMFRYETLLDALQAHADVTDESSAIQAAGLAPRLVAADVTNFKVTFAQDVALATQILLARRKGA